MCGSGVGGRRRRVGGGPAAAQGGKGGGGLRRHTPPLAGGLSAREEPRLPPPPLGVALSPRFPSARLAWQPPRRPAPRPARGGPAPWLGPAAEPVGSGLVLRPGRAASEPEVRTARAEALGDSRPGSPGQAQRGGDGKGTWEQAPVGVGGGIGDCSLPGTSPRVISVLETAFQLCPHPRGLLRSAAFPAPALPAP